MIMKILFSSILLMTSMMLNGIEQTLLPPTHYLEEVGKLSTMPAMSQKQPPVGKQEIVPSSTDDLDTKLVSFNFKDKPLADIINELAAEYKFNVLLPQVNTLTTKVTYNIAEKIPLKEAWDRLTAILDLAGYAWESRNNMLTLVKVDAAIRQDPLPLFVNEPLENLPTTEEVIQTIFYLSNMRVDDENLKITDVLKNLLSPTADIKTDRKTNSLILIDKSNFIIGAMQIIRELDLNGIREALEVMPLYYTQASIVEDLFMKQIYARDETAQNAYFLRNTKVIAMSRTNTVALMGSTKAIDRIRDFIIKYIDRPIESGESILHVYDLQYLDAQDFVKVLQSFIKPSASDQSTTQAATGPKQDFKNVIIAAENVSPTQGIQQSTLVNQAATGGLTAPQTVGVQQGGNRLIIAAQRNDWIRINKLIELLDKPQPQVALEVLVVDLNLEETKQLGSQMRNKQSFGDSVDKNINFQTANLATPVLLPAEFCPENQDITQFPSNALMANLLEFSQDANQNNVNIANTAPVGSLLISFNDPQGSGIWNVWQILNKYSNVTMLAQPFVITENNVQAKISITETRLLPGPAEVSPGGGVVQRFESKPAAISIDLVPRISLNNNINLQITVNVNEYLSSADNQLTRLVQTNANIGNGEVLALGGLIKTTDNIDIDETPLLSQIPIIGWFFKSKQKIRQKNNLMIFICPTIIEPKIGGGVDIFTKKKLHLAQDQLEDHVNFENLRDPITRWFFKPDPDIGRRTVDNYVHGTLDIACCDNAPECNHRPICGDPAWDDNCAYPSAECNNRPSCGEPAWDDNSELSCATTKCNRIYAKSNVTNKKATQSTKVVCANTTESASTLKKRISKSKGNPLKTQASQA